MLHAQISNFKNKNFIECKKIFEETREKRPYNAKIGPRNGVGAFVYASAWPKSGGRVPSVPPVDFHDILVAVQGELV